MISISITFWSALIGGFGPYIEMIRLRSFAASFWLPNFCHPFSIAAEKVLSLGPARCLASFQKDDEAAKLLPAH